MKEVDLYIYI